MLIRNFRMKQCINKNLNIKKFVVGALFNIPNYTCIPDIDMRGVRVEASYQFFNHQYGHFYYQDPITLYT